MFLCHSRRFFCWVFLLNFSVLAYAYYLQFYQGANPCPLCLVQRGILMLFMVVNLLAVLHHPGNKGYKRYTLVMLLLSVFGVCVAVRHVWLQSLPAGQAPACGMGLQQMLTLLPLTDVIKLLFQGSGECQKITRVWLGIPLSNATLLYFTALSGVLLWWARRLKLAG